MNIHRTKKNNKGTVNIYALEKTCDCWTKACCKIVFDLSNEEATFKRGLLVEGEGYIRRCKYEYLQEDLPDWYQDTKVYRDIK